jgi:phosphatidylglycerol:prolipoprotein diacylglycerol transferase
MEAPPRLFADPVSTIFSLNGYTWLGGFLAGVASLWFAAGRFNISSLALLDLASPCAAFGYGIARLGCLLAGDGDYGTATSLPWGMSFPRGLVPTAEHVHPTPVYECLAAILIFCYLWRIGKRSLPHGSIAARYLILTGIARFLVEFVRRNPPVLLGLSDAQIISLLCVAVGLGLLALNSEKLRSRNVFALILNKLFTNCDDRDLGAAQKTNVQN